MELSTTPQPTNYNSPTTRSQSSQTINVNNSPDSNTSSNIITLEPPPPSYSESRRNQNHPRSSSSEDRSNPNIYHRFEHSHCFPAGVFVLRNRSSLKALDVRGEGNQPGSSVIGYTPKRPTLVDGTILHRSNNQLFFLDWHGCLCAANCGLRLDVDENFRLILSRPQPISIFPTKSSHPPPQFKYDPLTRTISVKFSYDPTFPPSLSSSSPSSLDNDSSTANEQDFNESSCVEYLLELQPKSSINHPPPSSTALEKLSEWLPFSTRPLTSTSEGFSDGPASSPTTNQTMSLTRESFVVGGGTVDQSGTSTEDLDDSIDPSREIRVVSIAPGWREKFPNSSSPEAQKWLKRQWDIASIVVKPRYPSSQNNCSNDNTLRNRSRNGLDPSPPPSTNSVLSDLGEALEDLGNEISRVLRG